MSFAGVAAFAHAPLFRLLMVTSLFLFLTGATVIWLFARAYLPVLEGAMSNLPDEAYIQRGFLEWSGAPEAMLKQGAFLAIGVDLQGSPSLQTSADLNVLLGPTSWRIGSLLGEVELAYPITGKIELNRVELSAWWGAWEPVLVIGGSLATSMAVFCGWALVALVYMPMIRIVSFLGGRDVTLLGCWKLCLAAFLPGTLLWISTMIMYGLSRVPLLGLPFVSAAYLIVHSIYVVFAVTRLPGVSVAGSLGHPFTSSAQDRDPSHHRENPFSLDD